jgi:hypothetical protein
MLLAPAPSDLEHNGGHNVQRLEHSASILSTIKASLVHNWTSFNQKNPSYLVLTCHDFYPLVVSDDLNGRGADCVHLQA